MTCVYHLLNVLHNNNKMWASCSLAREISPSIGYRLSSSILLSADHDATTLGLPIHRIKKVAFLEVFGRDGQATQLESTSR